MHLKDIGALLPTVRTFNKTKKEHEDKFVNDDGDLTVLGEIVASLPIDVRLGKLIVYGHLLNVLDESVIIAAGIANKSIFTFPFDQKLK